MARKKAHDDIIRHMERHFGPVQEQALIEIVPTLGVAINVIPARPHQNPLILFTTGMSDRPQTVPAGADEYRYTELFVRLPGDWPTTQAALRDDNYFWPFKWLRQIAAYPHDNDTWLGGPFPIIANDEPPQPLAPNTKLSCLLLLRETGEEGTVACQDGRQVALYSLIPLYTEERDLEMAQGIRGLFQALQSRGVSFVVEPGRVNAVTGR
jgi:hypothetical protein